MRWWIVIGLLLVGLSALPRAGARTSADLAQPQPGDEGSRGDSLHDDDLPDVARCRPVRLSPPRAIRARRRAVAVPLPESRVPPVPVPPPIA